MLAGRLRGTVNKAFTNMDMKLAKAQLVTYIGLAGIQGDGGKH